MKAIVGLIASLGIALFAGQALAQGSYQPSYPEKTVRILVGFPPGGPPDVAARVLAEKFSDTWGKSVVVENLTGSGGNLAIERAAEFAGVIRSETEQWAKLISDAGIKVTE